MVLGEYVMILRIKIKENSEDLVTRIKSERDVEQRDKLKLLKMILDNEVTEVKEAASKLYRHRNTISGWLSKYRIGGITKLLFTKKSGKKEGHLKYLSQGQLDLLKEELNNEKGFNSYLEIKLWIKSQLEVDIPYPTIWNLVRKRLKAKLKVPRPVHIKKDLVKEESFKKTLLMS